MQAANVAEGQFPTQVAKSLPSLSPHGATVVVVVVVVVVGTGAGEGVGVSGNLFWQQSMHSANVSLGQFETQCDKSLPSSSPHGSGAGEGGGEGDGANLFWQQATQSPKPSLGQFDTQVDKSLPSLFPQGALPQLPSTQQS